MDITTKQAAALKSIATIARPAIQIDAHPTTLTALVGKGLAEREYDRTDRRWNYRISEDGTTLLQKIRKAEDEAQRPAQDIEGRVNDAYIALVSEVGEWVGLRLIRLALWDIDRADLDATLLDMVLRPGVMIDPEFNQKTLTPADRAAALHMGGEDCHLLAIGRR